MSVRHIVTSAEYAGDIEKSGKCGKPGILMVAYGPANQSGALALRDVSVRVQNLFPDIPLRWAFSSPRMRSRLAQQRKKTDSVYKALCRMRFDGYTRVAVQSLHVIPGFEYELLLREVERAGLEGGPERLRVGLPLLGNPGEMELAARALISHLPPESGPEDAIVCVGHGSGLAAPKERAAGVGQNSEERCNETQSAAGQNSRGTRPGVFSGLKNPPGGPAPGGYEGLELAAGMLDPRIHIGSLSGEFGLDCILERLQAKAVRRVWLMPLLSVVGKHAEEDLAGEGDVSWRGRFERAGISCLPVLRGLAEYEGFLSIWLSHLQQAVDALQE